MQISDHPPSASALFCGRPAYVTACRAAKNQAVTYSAGCLKRARRTAPELAWEDGLGSQSDCLAALEGAVVVWNTRERSAERG